MRPGGSGRLRLLRGRLLRRALRRALRRGLGGLLGRRLRRGGLRRRLLAAGCSRSSSPRPRPTSRSRRTPAGLGRLGLVDAPLQGREQVDDLGLLALGLGRLGDVTALDLRRDELRHRLGVARPRLLGLVVARQGVDERGRHGELLGRRVESPPRATRTRGAHLVRPEQRLEHDDASRTRSTARVIAGADRTTCTEGHPVGLLQRVAEQDVGLEAGLVGLEVIALVESSGSICSDGTNFSIEISLVDRVGKTLRDPRRSARPSARRRPHIPWRCRSRAPPRRRSSRRVGT